MSEVVEEYNPAVIWLGKFVIGFGLVGLVLWLSPVALSELINAFAIPLLMVLTLAAAVGLIGSGVLEMLNSKDLGRKVQEYVREMRETAEHQ